jgi:hypothetical protein
VHNKLFIYDSVDDDNREQAEGRFDHDDDIFFVPCASGDQLRDALDRLVPNPAARFNRVLVQTHGGPGRIKVGTEHLFWTYFGSYLKGRGYEALFPTYTKIYFDGCNVGADDDGTDFLLAVGSTLLLRGGGVVAAFTNPGYGFDGWAPFVGGHTLHYRSPFSNSLKEAYFGPGGHLIDPPD